MIGYTVNGKFADASGNFQINREDIGAAADEHEHAISAINGLSAELSCKADADHTHEMITQFYAKNQTPGPHNINLTASNMQINATENVIKLECNSVSAGDVLWINNSASAHPAVIQFTTNPDISAGVCSFGEVSLIRFKENRYA